MLGKLFKYEFKSTSRWMLPTYALVLLMAFINMFFIGRNGQMQSMGVPGTLAYRLLSIIPALFMFIYIISLVGLAMVTIFISGSRFYTNLLSNEGYISMTLPVKTHEHMLVKLLTSFAWIVGSVIVGWISFLILMGRTGLFGEIVRNFPRVAYEFNMLFEGKGNLMLFEMIVYGIVASFSLVLMIYTALALGQLSNNHKIGMAIVAFLGISFVMSIIEAVAFGSTVSGLLFMSNIDVMSSITSFLGFGIAWEAIVSVGYFFVTRHILKNRMNLQ